MKTATVNKQKQKPMNLFMLIFLYFMEPKSKENNWSSNLLKYIATAVKFLILYMNLIKLKCLIQAVTFFCC